MAISLAGFPKSCSCTACNFCTISLVRLRLPSRITAAMLNLESSHAKRRGHHLRHPCLLLSIALRWLVTISATSPFSETIARLVEFCTRPGTSGLIATHAVRHRHQQVDNSLGVRQRPALCPGAAAFSIVIWSSGSNPPRSAFHAAAASRQQRTKLCLLWCIEHHDRRCFARDRILRAPAVDGRDLRLRACRPRAAALLPRIRNALPRPW